MNNKKLSFFVLSLFIASLFISSCARPERVKPKENTVTVWAFSWTKDALEKIKVDFEKENPDIKVKVELVNWADLRTKLQASISSNNNVPDVAALSSAWVGGLIASGGISKLDKYIAEDPNYKAKFLPEAFNIYNYKGNQYGIPLDLDLIVLFYRSDIVDPLLKKLKMKTFPTTWDDFVKLGKAIAVDKDKDGKIDRYAMALSTSDVYTFYTAFMVPSGANYLTKDLKRPAFNSKESKKALKFYIDLVKKHKIAALWTASFGDIVSGLKSGFIVMYPIGPWYKGEMKTNMPEMKGKWKIAVMPTPTGKGPYSALTGLCLGMPYNAKNKEGGWKFIKYLTSNKKALLTYFKAVGSPIPVTSLWDDPAFKQVDPYFNQKIYDPILKAVKNSKPIQIIPQQKVLDILGLAQEKAVRGEQEVGKALDEAAKESIKYLK